MTIKLFTKESQLLMKYSFSKMKNIKSLELINLFSFLDSFPVKPLIEKSISNQKLYQETILSSGFASKKVVKSAKNLKKKIQIKLRNNLINIEVNIYHNTNKNQSTLIKKIIEYIQYIISFSELNKTIVINIYLTGLRKIKNNGIPGKDNVNSGSCLNSDKYSTINIWRKEELLKVLLHELIHALCYDKYSDNEMIKNHYQTTYKISSNVVNTGEAYTEIWANLLNCYLVSKMFRNSEELFYNLVSLEKYFCFFQAQKIFHLTDLNKKVIDINYHTNVLSYYIIRMELYNNINGFLDFCLSNNEDYVQILDGDKFLLFLEDNSNSNKIKRKNTTFNNIDKNDFIYKTLRMTSIELAI